MSSDESSPPLSCSGKRKLIARRRCSRSQPDARVLYSTEYKRWTVQILPQCHVKTFRSRRDAQQYASAKKAELAQSSESPITHDPHTQHPIIEV